MLATDHTRSPATLPAEITNQQWIYRRASRQIAGARMSPFKLKFRALFTRLCAGLFALSLLALSLTGPARAEATPAWGSHGMAVFGGREALYASHLAMFHAPHDSQVVFRFHLQDGASDKLLRTALAKRPELWTMEPEEFDLLRLAPAHAEPLRRFNARLVQGHFERGGTERLAQQTIIVDEVILFRPLTMAQRSRTEGRYHLIGKASERFLLKEIDRRPDFDLIIALKPLSKLNESLAAPAIIALPGEHLQAPSAGLWRQTLRNQTGKNLNLGRVLYFETDDLK